MKRIVLCADDFGQAPAISQGIFQLVQQQSLTATSCMVNMPGFSEDAKMLLPYRAQIDIGLHFNLTHGKPLSHELQQQSGDDLYRFKTLMQKSLLYQLNQSAIEAELHAQLDAFQKICGFLPDYIDGHQHVHQFPIIRDALRSVYRQRLRELNIYIRLPNENIVSPDFFSHFKDSILNSFKKTTINLMGVNGLKDILDKDNILYNTSFAGIYSFSTDQPYRQYFLKFLQMIKDGGLIMCHPGLASNDATDPIANARKAEFDYLSSPAFQNDCEVNQIKLCKFKDLKSLI